MRLKKTAKIQLRIGPEEKRRWEDAADRMGLTLSAWITQTCRDRVIAQQLAIQVPVSQALTGRKTL